MPTETIIAEHCSETCFNAVKLVIKCFMHVLPAAQEIALPSSCLYFTYGSQARNGDTRLQPGPCWRSVRPMWDMNSGLPASNVHDLFRIRNMLRDAQTVCNHAKMHGRVIWTQREHTCSAEGTSPATIRCARPSATAVFPTPGSPIRTGLFLVRRDSIWMQRLHSSHSLSYDSNLTPRSKICYLIIRTDPFRWSARACLGLSGVCLGTPWQAERWRLGIASYTGSKAEKAGFAEVACLMRSSRPMTGSSFPFLAASVKSRAYLDSASYLLSGSCTCHCMHQLMIKFGGIWSTLSTVPLILIP